MYLDDGEQVGLEEQPFWYGGLLHVYNMGRNQLRAELNVGAEDRAAYLRFDETAQRLAAAGGGVISVYYHPNEFVTTEFWDAGNFAHGANPARPAWVRPQRRTHEESERCYGVLRRFVEHMKGQPGVQFLTARDVLAHYEPVLPGRADRRAIAEHLKQHIIFAEIGTRMLSPADMLLALLELEPQVVDGPTSAGSSTWAKPTIPAAAFQAAVADATDFVRRTQRLPAQVFLGAETLSLADFAATLAGNVLAPQAEVPVARGHIEFERYFATDPKKPFNWVIHPVDFSGAPLLDLARLQGWTLKPARIARN